MGLFVLLEAPGLRSDTPAPPEWVRSYAPWLGRLWGEGLIKDYSLAINRRVLDWSRSDPDGLVKAARHLAGGRPLEEDENASRLHALITADRSRQGSIMRAESLNQLLAARSEGLVEAAQILNSHRDEVIAVMSRYGYTDPNRLGGYLDRDLAQPAHTGNGQ